MTSACFAAALEAFGKAMATRGTEGGSGKEEEWGQESDRELHGGGLYSSDKTFLYKGKAATEKRKGC